MIFRQKSELIVDFIKKNLEHKNVLIIDGVRQVGKTSAVRQALGMSGTAFLEINLETQKVLRDRIAATREFSEFLALLKTEFNFVSGEGTALFIDEANECPRLGHYVRQMKEDLPRQTVILSGSMMMRLFRDKDIRIPVGRYETLTIQPFNFTEFLAANESTESDLRKYGLREKLKHVSGATISPTEHELFLEVLQHYFYCGGVPTLALLYLAHGPGRIDAVTRAMADYLAALKDDFLRLFSAEYADLFSRAITATSNLQSHPFKKSALIQNNNRLAENVLSVFENWKFIYKIEQKTFSTTTANSLHPKRYLFDVGIAKMQRETGVPAIHILNTLGAQQREPLGGLVEQLVCCELIHRYGVLSGYKEGGFEIDFIIKTDDRTVPIECKAALKISQKHYLGLDLYHKRFGNKIAVIVSLAPFARTKRQGYEIIHLPAYAIESLPGLLADTSSIQSSHANTPPSAF